MGTTDLGKTFAIVDPHKDLTDVYRIETAFSKLESDAASVFQILYKAVRRGRPSVELMRSQLKVTLIKFLFLVHCRNGGRARQYVDGRFDTVTASMVEQYRVKHGLTNTYAVGSMPALFCSRAGTGGRKRMHSPCGQLVSMTSTKAEIHV